MHHRFIVSRFTGTALKKPAFAWREGERGFERDFVARIDF